MQILDDTHATSLQNKDNNYSLHIFSTDNLQSSLTLNRKDPVIRLENATDEDRKEKIIPTIETAK